MVKAFLVLLAVYVVSGAPAVPFARYGLPGDNEGEVFLPTAVLPGVKNLEEKFLPLEQFQSPPENLQGTRNLAEKTQLPDTLPGVRNLAEKSIPESITLRKLPAQVPDFPKLEVESVPVLQNIPERIEQPLVPVPTPDFQVGEEILSDAIPGPVESIEDKAPGSLIIPPGTKLKLEDDRGQYSHGFSTPDGTQVQETGHLITTNGGWEYVIAKEGSYSYTSPEGTPVTVSYIADHNGFRITGQKIGRR
ncbi:endocuticle structural glycoprotein SgAbd-1 [Cephus cinctus]|uniref:Endocuticle structural glycoprotein SgAbd-1 n=1 Tax=Cephus cinctus TaxID=211228 RepID=A0AAJ7BL04_CEPCN|nr:endocuticle structural glycoprotein SgAbd-1 [Cephus cinctus]